MIVTKGKGIEINQQDGIPLTSEHNFYWDPFLANILLHDAHEFCPRVNFKRTPGSPDFQTVFMQSAQDKGGAVDHDQIMPGSEICGTSKSLADQKVRIPVQDVDAFVRAIDRIHKKSESPETTPSARTFMRNLRIPDPLVMKSAWRVSNGFNRNLLVLWGYSAADSNSTILPLTETSAHWPDSRYRVDIKERMAEAGLLSTTKFNWPKLMHCILAGLVAVLVIFLLAWGLSALATYSMGPDNSDQETEQTGGNPPVVQPGGKTPVVPGGNPPVVQPGGKTPQKPPVVKSADYPFHVAKVSQEDKGDYAAVTFGVTPDKEIEGVKYKISSWMVNDEERSGGETITLDLTYGENYDISAIVTVDKKEQDVTALKWNESKPGNPPPVVPPGEDLPVVPPGEDPPEKPPVVPPEKPPVVPPEKPPVVPPIEDPVVYSFHVSKTDEEDKGDFAAVTFVVTPDKEIEGVKYKISSWMVNDEERSGGETITLDLTYGENYDISAIVTVDKKEQDVTALKWNESKPGNPPPVVPPGEDPPEKPPVVPPGEDPPENPPVVPPGEDPPENPPVVPPENPPVVPPGEDPPVPPVVETGNPSGAQSGGEQANVVKRCPKCHSILNEDGTCPKCKIPAILNYTFHVAKLDEDDKGDFAAVKFGVRPDPSVGSVPYEVSAWTVNDQKQSDGETFTTELSYSRRYVISATVTIEANGEKKPQEVLSFQWNRLNEPAWMIRSVGNNDKEYQVLCTNSSNTKFKVVNWYRPEFRDGEGKNISQFFSSSDPEPLVDDGKKARFEWKQEHIGEYIMTLKADVEYTPSGSNRKPKVIQVQNSFVMLNGSTPNALITGKQMQARKNVYHCLSVLKTYDGKDAAGTPGSGTAFAISDKLLLTNYHVAVGSLPGSKQQYEVDRTKPLVLTNGNEKDAFYATVVDFHKDGDIALLKLCDKDGKDTDRKLPAFFNVSEKQPQIGARVFSLGYPEGANRLGEPVFVEGKIENVGEESGEVISHFTNTISGFNGGPVIYLDEDNTVAGINTALHLTDEPAAERGAASAAEIRKKFPEISENEN